MTTRAPLTGIEFGYKLPNCAGVLCEPEWAAPDTILELAHHATDLGYDCLWFHDHLVAPRELDRVETPNFYEPLMTMASVGGAIPDIGLGVATLILPFREPALLAKQLATLAGFLPGRIIAGVGIGRYESEFEALGLDLFRKRGRVTDEYLEVMAALNDREASTTYEGEFRRLSEARFFPKPSEGSAARIWVGGNSPRAIARTARFATGWVPAALDPAAVREGKRALVEEARAIGRDPEAISLGLSLTIERTEATTMEDPEERGLHTHASILAGGAVDVARGLDDYVAAGVTHFLLSFRAGSLQETHERMGWFQEQVRPLMTAGRRSEGETEA